MPTHATDRFELSDPAPDRRLRGRLLLFALSCAVLGAAHPADAEEEAAAPPSFDRYQLVLLMRPAERAPLSDERIEEIQGLHLRHLTRMAEEGHLVVAGPFADQDDDRFRGLALYRVGSAEEARRLAQADPAVEAGRLEVLVMSWYTEAGALAFPRVE
jgi:uncharacterized protein YciI